MFSVSKGSVSLYVCPTKQVATACVVFGIKAGKAEIDSILETGEIDDSTVFLSMIKFIKQKLKGNTALANKNKITKICCKTIDGELLFSVTCAPAISIVKRIIKTVLKNLSPKSFSLYSDILREKGLKPDDEAFSASVNTLLSSLESVDVVVLGRCGIYDDAKFKEVSGSLMDVYSVPKIKVGKGKKRDETFQVEQLEITKVPLSPVAASLTKDYIEQKFNTKIMLKDNAVIFYTRKLAKVKSLGKKETVEAYLKQISRMKDANEQVLYYAAHRCRMNTTQLIKAAKGKLDSPGLLKEISDALSKL